MAEYVEREALIQHIRRMPIPEKAGYGNTWLDNCGIGVNAAIREVKSFPAADVAPVRHGRWERIKVPNQWDKGRCSACKRIFESSRWGTKYCSYCGALMDGGNEDE